MTSIQESTRDENKNSSTCAVIGAGIGGLASACLLAAKGHSVTLFEKNETAGGKMQEIRADGFRFDTGPSLMTMPEVLSQIFDAAGRSMNDEIELTEPDPICRYIYPDGTIFDSFTQLDKAIAEVERIAPEDRDAYIEFLNFIRELYEKTADAFLFNPLYELRDLSSLRLLDALSIDAFTTVSSRIDRTFTSPYLRTFFKRFTTYNGSDPYQAPGTLNVIPHIELNEGGYYVKGGLYAVARSLRNLAESLGVQFRFRCDANALETKGKKVNALRLADGSRHTFDWFFSNSDATETLTRMLPNHAIPTWYRTLQKNLEPSCSGFVLLLGCTRQWDILRHHTIFFSDRYQQEFTDMFRYKIMPEDPTIYVANTSYSDPEDAPEGGSNLFVLVNAPYLSDKTQWDRDRDHTAEKILETLESRGLSGLRSSIRYRHIITPQDLYNTTRSNKGSIYGTSSNGRFSAFLRPRNRVRALENLFLTGGSTHPGGGIPLVIQSAIHAVTLFERKINE
jgi:phytoene desaturase